MRKRGNVKNPQPDWLRNLSLGDVLESRSGNMRVVRRISKFDNGDTATASFAIKRCSWTGRGSTCYNYTDILAHYKPVGVKIGLGEAQKVFEAHGNEYPVRFTCCQGKEMP